MHKFRPGDRFLFVSTGLPEFDGEKGTVCKVRGYVDVITDKRINGERLFSVPNNTPAIRYLGMRVNPKEALEVDRAERARHDWPA